MENVEGVLDGDIVAQCACHDSAARFLDNDGEYGGQFDGSIAVRVRRPRRTPSGQVAVGLTIVGYTTTSDVPGLGRTTLDFDFSRPVRPSAITSHGSADLFPARQTMVLNILARCGKFGDRVLRSRRPGRLVNEKADSFPPNPGATYVLQRTVELEDESQPGPVLLRLAGVRTEIISTEFNPATLNVGQGFQIFRPYGDGWVAERTAARPTLRFTAPDHSGIEVRITDGRGRLVSTIIPEVERGAIAVADVALPAESRHYSFQLWSEGKPRSARMPLIRP